MWRSHIIHFSGFVFLKFSNFPCWIPLMNIVENGPEIMDFPTKNIIILEYSREKYWSLFIHNPGAIPFKMIHLIFFTNVTKWIDVLINWQASASETRIFGTIGNVIIINIIQLNICPYRIWTTTTICVYISSSMSLISLQCGYSVENSFLRPCEWN